MAHEHVPANPPTDSHAAAHGHEPAEHPHPTWSTYWKVALVLTVITIIEVWAYYIPQFVASRAFVPSLLIMSAAKFVIVVMFYMHLKYDHRLFRLLFTGPFIIAIATIISLMFLFGQLVMRLRA
jgi:cytochrome c oxidase subunit IV